VVIVEAGADVETGGDPCGRLSALLSGSLCKKCVGERLAPALVRSSHRRRVRAGLAPALVKIL
jgi:hypothetical protein